MPTFWVCETHGSCQSSLPEWNVYGVVGGCPFCRAEAAETRVAELEANAEAFLAPIRALREESRLEWARAALGRAAHLERKWMFIPEWREAQYLLRSVARELGLLS